MNVPRTDAAQDGSRSALTRYKPTPGSLELGMAKDGNLTDFLREDIVGRWGNVERIEAGAHLRRRILRA